MFGKSTTASVRSLSFESLERRAMMAANVTAKLTDGLLRIEGTPNNDTIIVRQIGTKVSVDGVRISGSGAINKIEVVGLGGNDRIRLDGNGAVNQSVQVPSLVFGGTGDDFIVGGAKRDELQGNAGNDIIYGMLGNDLLFGHDGNDLLYGGAGNDGLQGNLGNDELLGESGNDTLFGQEGQDWLWGGAGDDYLNGGSGLDVGYGGTGRDEFVNYKNDVAFFLVHPHLRSPVRGLGDLEHYGVQDQNVL